MLCGAGCSSGGRRDCTISFVWRLQAWRQGGERPEVYYGCRSALMLMVVSSTALHEQLICRPSACHLLRAPESSLGPSSIIRPPGDVEADNGNLIPPSRAGLRGN